MKKSLRNFVLACTATAAVSLALATSAFAADGFNITEDITYDQAAGTASVDTGFIQSLGGQVTILIYEDSVDVDPANLTADQILYINQDTSDTEDGLKTFVGMGLKNGLEANKTYVVKIGGENVTEGIYEGKFTVGEDGEIILGDVTGDENINLSDFSAIVNHYLGIAILEGNQFKAGDVNKDNVINLSDSSVVINYYLGIGTIE